MQRCPFCQTEFEEPADTCPACGQQPLTLEPDAPQLSENVSRVDAPAAVSPAQNVASEAATEPTAPGTEPEGPDEAQGLPTSAEIVPLAAEEDQDPQNGLTPALPDDERTSQDNRPLPQEQIPELAVSSPEPPVARFAPLWRKPPARVLTMILAIIFVVSGSGAAIYVLTLPHPVLRVSGPRQVGSTPAGSADQVFHISGQQFAANSAITFLLDGRAAPGAPKVKSDAHGNFTANLPITDDWLVGRHTLTAKDDLGDATASGVQVAIVRQGDAGTPGPNGAPANDASFSIVLNGFFITSSPGTGGITQDQLIVTGRPDPAGGKVCDSGDDGQPHTEQLVNQDGSQFGTITTTYGCSGTYSYGHLTYTKTIINIVFKFLSGFQSGTTCTGGGFISRQLEGTFSDATTISGTARYPKAPPIPCNRGGPITMLSQGPQSTTWTGTIEAQ